MINPVPLHTLFESAAEVLVTATARAKYQCWDDAINAPAATPTPPTTRGEAMPRVLLRGPFEGIPNLICVALYVGIGFIEVRALNATHCTYETTVIDGVGVEARNAFMTAARALYFYDVQFQPEGHA